MEIGFTAHRVPQSTMYPIAGNIRDTSATKVKENSSDSDIKFDLRTPNTKIEKPSSKFTELDLWKLLKEKGVPLWLILEILSKFRADKAKEANQSIKNSSNVATTSESTNETRLNVVM